MNLPFISYPFYGLVEGLWPVSEPEECVEAEYIVNTDEQLSGFQPKHLNLKFKIHKDNSIELQKVLGYKKRLAVDFLMMDRPADFRIIASSSIDLFSAKEAEKFIGRCSFSRSATMQTIHGHSKTALLLI
jgi:hypothetical protein